MIDKNDFINVIKKDLNIREYSEKQYGESFENIDNIFEESLNNRKIDDINNIYVTCSINASEAENGCTKNIRYISNEVGKRVKKDIDLAIPSGIVNKELIWIKGVGSVTRQSSNRGDLIVKIFVK